MDLTSGDLWVLINFRIPQILSFLFRVDAGVRITEGPL